MVEAYSFYSDRDRWAIILEDFGGESLKQLLQTQKRLTLSAFWSVAIQVADILGKIHLLFNSKQIKSAGFFLAYQVSFPWKKHIQLTLKPVLLGYQSQLANESLLFAAFNAYCYSFHLYFFK